MNVGGSGKRALPAFAVFMVGVFLVANTYENPFDILSGGSMEGNLITVGVGLIAVAFHLYRSRK
jgi:hypothetical protein